MPTLSEVVEFSGHAMVRATHRTTMEITRDSHLTTRGDCIVGVSADKTLSDFSEDVRRAIRSGKLAIKMTIATASSTFRLVAKGDPRLTLSSKKDIVIRKSVFVCGRTLAVSSDAAAHDLPRRLVEELRNPDCRARLLVEVDPD